MHITENVWANSIIPMLLFYNKLLFFFFFLLMIKIYNNPFTQ